MQGRALRSCVSLVCICLASQTVGNAETETRSTWTFTPKLKRLSSTGTELPAGTVTLTRSDTLRVGLYIEIGTDSNRTDTNVGFDLLAGAVHFYSDDGLTTSDIGPVVRTLRAQGNGWTTQLDSAPPGQNTTIGDSGVSLFGPFEEANDEESWAFLWLDIDSTGDPRGVWCQPVSGICEVFLGELTVNMADMPLNAAGTLKLKAAGVLSATDRVQIETTHRRGVPETAEGNVVEYAVSEATVEVPASWDLIPSGLVAGDAFRLQFVSSTKRDATSTDIADYNTHVQSAAAAGHAGIQSYSAHFRALGSTSTVDARDNTGTTYTSTAKGVPIYWLDGQSIADDYEDFYDGTWASTIDKDENGSGIGTQVWTGSANDGTASSPLGATGNQVQAGHPGRQDQHFVFRVSSSSTENAIYGLSPVFRIMAGPASGSPSLNSATVNGATLTLTYNEALDEMSKPRRAPIR